MLEFMQKTDTVLQEQRRRIVEAVSQKPNPATQTIGRQTLDHLDAAILFHQQLMIYLQHLEQATEEAAANG